MNIGFVGLGKLGLPVACAMAMKGHDVIGFDLDPERMTKAPQPYRETGPDGTGDFNHVLANIAIGFGTLQEVADHAEIIFVAVQTPHEPRFEGITPLTEERADFNYTHLRDAVKALRYVISRQTVIAIISTALPGTMRREIVPLLSEHMELAYNPSFIAMGDTMRDFLHPEFVLCGAGDWALDRMRVFYSSITGAPFYRCSIESAELIKVAYNTFIGMKITFANTLMEMCHKLEGADVHEVTDGLKLAKRRLISGAYMAGGMGDGGGCHPRDNIAMSWLAGKLDLSHNLFDDIMRTREDQAAWLADLMVTAARSGRVKGELDLPLGILGYAYKPETNLTVGSCSLLVEALLNVRGFLHITKLDPHIFAGEITSPIEPHVWLIGTKHPQFTEWFFPEGSIVIDPWRYIPDQEGVTVIRLGERREAA